MKPMKIKRYICWKRDVAAAQKRVALAKAIFEDAMARHFFKIQDFINNG
jgi:hypothetical protein